MTSQEAKTHAKEVIGKCMFPAFATVDENGCPRIRAMMAAAVDEDLTVYYITSRMTSKCRHIAANPNVSSLWTDIVEPMRDWRSVLVSGKAVISDDRALRERFWMEELRFVFPDGVDDPNYVILVVKPTEVTVASNDTMPPVVVRL